MPPQQEMQQQPQAPRQQPTAHPPQTARSRSEEPISDGVRDAQGMRLTLKAQHKDLAELTHASRPRVSEHLMEFDK
jgi:hypothetical protein